MIATRLQEIEEALKALSKTGWKVTRFAVAHEDGDKPIAEISLTYDPTDFKTIL